MVNFLVLQWNTKKDWDKLFQLAIECIVISVNIAAAINLNTTTTTILVVIS